MMSGKIYKQIKFTLPIYDQDICFINTNDYIKLNRLHNTNEDSEPLAFASTLYNKKGIRYYAIVVNTKHSEISIGIIAHECLHIVNMIFGVVGIKADNGNDEAQAYLLEYLMNEAMKFYYPNILIK